MFKKKVDNLYPIKIDDEFFYVQKEVYDFIYGLKSESHEHKILIADLEARVNELKPIIESGALDPAVSNRCSTCRFCVKSGRGEILGCCKNVVCVDYIKEGETNEV